MSATIGTMAERIDPIVLRPARIQRAQLREALANGLWVVPIVAIVGAWVVAWILVTIDHHLGALDQSAVAFGGGPAGAQSLLATIATAVLGFTGLVFSIMIVALQLSSSQFSPRVMRTFLRDRGTQVTLGIFVGTFVYTLVVLQSVREGAAGQHVFVPGHGVTGAIVLVLVTVVAFVYFVHHMASSIRVVSIIESVARETRATIDAHFPAPVTGDRIAELPTSRGEQSRQAALATREESEPTITLGASRAGVLAGFDTARLVALATASDVLIEIKRSVGDFVAYGVPLITVHGQCPKSSLVAIDRCVLLTPERTMQQDVSFGFRQLVDIAERALSPAINDPTTALQALDRIHDLLRRLAVRPFPTGVANDVHDNPRLIWPTESWHDVIVLSFAEIRFYGSGSFQIARRLRAAFDDLIELVSPQRATVLASMRTELDAGIERSFPDAIDRIRARTPDAGGLGSDDE